MEYYPIYLDIKDKPCLVVGGGEVAARKTESLVKAGANVTVIAPEISQAIKSAQLIQREFRPSDVNGYFLVIAATSNETVNEMISTACREKKILVNVVDDKDISDFIFGSVVDLDPLIISICTSGVAPALSKKLRLELEEKYRDDHKALLQKFKEERKNKPRKHE